MGVQKKVNNWTSVASFTSHINKETEIRFCRNIFYEFICFVFFSFYFWSLIVFQHVVWSHYRYSYSWGSTIFEPLSREPVKKCSQWEATFLRNKCSKKNLNCFHFFNSAILFINLRQAHCFYFQAWTPCVLRSFFLISILSKKFDQMFFLDPASCTFLYKCLQF